MHRMLSCAVQCECCDVEANSDGHIAFNWTNQQVFFSPLKCVF